MQGMYRYVPIMCLCAHTLSRKHMYTYMYYVFVYSYKSTHAHANVCVLNPQFPTHASYTFTEGLLSFASHHTFNFINNLQLKSHLH